VAEVDLALLQAQGGAAPHAVLSIDGVLVRRLHDIEDLTREEMDSIDLSLEKAARELRDTLAIARQEIAAVDRQDERRRAAAAEKPKKPRKRRSKKAAAPVEMPPLVEEPGSWPARAMAGETIDFVAKEARIEEAKKREEASAGHTRDYTPRKDVWPSSRQDHLCEVVVGARQAAAMGGDRSLEEGAGEVADAAREHVAGLPRGAAEKTLRGAADMAGVAMPDCRIDLALWAAAVWRDALARAGVVVAAEMSQEVSHE
jgi:hypothetical protein